MPAKEFAALLRSPAAVDDLAADGPTAVVLDGALPDESFRIPAMLPVVVVRSAEQVDSPTEIGDVVANGAALDAIVETVDAAPQAGTSLAVLLRASEASSVAAGLMAESAVYGVLQAGPEFAAWRSSQPISTRADPDGGAARCDRADDTIRIVLARPGVRNALDADLRDALAEALQVALSDPSAQVEITGEGACFSSGGHLDEFGSRSDPATAHLIRMARSLAFMLHELSDRTHVFVHGPCRGSGVELPAFAGRVTADPDATFGLPEVGLGLIPGAGGTVSLPRRIGRRRTAWLALTRSTIDARTARAWGLVDEVRPWSTAD